MKASMKKAEIQKKSPRTLFKGFFQEDGIMKKSIALALALALVLSAFAVSAFADPKGDELARKYFDRKKAEDTKATGSIMTLLDKAGGKKIRKLDVYYQGQTPGEKTPI